MEAKSLNWRVIYHKTTYYFDGAESTFRFFLSFYNKRDAKTADVQFVNDEGDWESIEF